MRRCPEYVYLVTRTRFRVAGTHAAANVRGPSREHARFGRMRAPRAEFHHVAAQRRLYHPRRLGRDRRLETDHRQQIGLRDLRLNDGRAYCHKRLAREYRGAFGYREHVAGEAQSSQHLEKLATRILELRDAPQVGDFLRGDLEVEKVVDGLRESGGQNEITIVRQPPHGEFEGRAILRFPGLEIAGSHGELIKIGGKAEAHYCFFFSGCASRTSPTACRKSFTMPASSS